MILTLLSDQHYRSYIISGESGESIRFIRSKQAFFEFYLFKLFGEVVVAVFKNRVFGFCVKLVLVFLFFRRHPCQFKRGQNSVYSHEP